MLCCRCRCQVPIDVMASMTRVPAAYLKQLAEERQIFNELPPAVKQQVGPHARSHPYYAMWALSGARNRTEAVSSESIAILCNGNHAWKSQCGVLRCTAQAV